MYSTSVPLNAMYYSYRVHIHRCSICARNNTAIASIALNHIKSHRNAKNHFAMSKGNQYKRVHKFFIQLCFFLCILKNFSENTVGRLRYEFISKMGKKTEWTKKNTKRNEQHKKKHLPFVINFKPYPNTHGVPRINEMNEK